MYVYGLLAGISGGSLNPAVSAGIAAASAAVGGAADLRTKIPIISTYYSNIASTILLYYYYYIIY